MRKKEPKKEETTWNRDVSVPFFLLFFARLSSASTPSSSQPHDFQDLFFKVFFLHSLSLSDCFVVVFVCVCVCVYCCCRRFLMMCSSLRGSFVFFLFHVFWVCRGGWRSSISVSFFLFFHLFFLKRTIWILPNRLWFSSRRTQQEKKKTEEKRGRLEDEKYQKKKD